MQQTILKGMTIAELEEFFAGIGQQRFRGRQMFAWMYAKRAEAFAEVTVFSAALRAALEQRAAIGSIALADTQRSAEDGTTKYLFRLADGNYVEAVLIPSEARVEGGSPRRHTLCISTQAGCPLGCRFCATGSMKLTRNLAAYEILDQLLHVQRRAPFRLTNVVYMGMGEPMLNYENVMRSAEILTHEEANLVGAHHITISTAGVVPGIARMAEEKRTMKLAVSLHTLDDGLRTQLMPINKKYPLAALLAAVERYHRAARRRPTFEYVLFDGLNDTADDARRLIALARRIPCKVNVIPFHSIDFTQPSGLAARLKPSPPARVAEFVRRLRAGNVTVMIRSSAGRDIDAACGQLAVGRGKNALAHW